jgi:CHAT domain-containing protein
MRNEKRLYLSRILLILLMVVGTASGMPSLQNLPGLIVEIVTPDAPGAKAGLKDGDRLLTYNEMALASPAALQAAEENTFGKQEITLQVQRGEDRLTLKAPPGSLGVRARPELPAAILQLYEEGRAAMRAQKLKEAIDRWEAAAKASLESEGLAAAWIYWRVGEAHESQRRWRQAIEAYTEAWKILKESGDVAARSRILAAMGRASLNLSDFAAAEKWYEQASKIDETAGHEMWGAGDFNNLGNIGYNRGDLQTAQDYYRRALVIFERLTPGSLVVAGGLNNLGNIARERNDFQTAQDYYRRSLEIRERLAPGSLAVAGSFTNLGAVAKRSGDLQAAQDYYHRAFMIQERLAPDSLDVAFSLNNLGLITHERGALQAAQDYFLRALTIKERLAPGSLTVSVSLSNLGIVAQKRGDLQAAQDYYRRALTIQERLAPNSLGVADVLDDLGTIAKQRGDLQVARDCYRRVLEIRERLAPQSLEVASTLTDLGDLAFSAQRFSDAKSLFDRAVAIVESKRRVISSAEARSLLLARYQAPYSGLLRTYVALDDLPAAFATFERARARSLVELLAERNLDLRADAPADLLKRQDQLDQNRSSASAALAKLNSPKDDARIEELQAALTRYDIQQRELEAQFRRASPRFANIQYPDPLDLTAARAAMDEGTLLLTYYIDERQTYLFAVTKTDLKVFTLPLEETSLTRKVNLFRDAVSQKRLGNPLGDAQRLGSQLYDDLIRPAQEWVSRAKRILICPDRALHALPVAALISRTDTKPRYFIEDKPLHIIVSMTVYAETRKSESPDKHKPKPAVLAFGDAIYAKEQTIAVNKPQTEPPTTDLRGGWKLTPLPGSRREVEEIARLYGDAATVKLGREATKTAAQKESPNYTILHFAVHGWLDDRIGLNSGLALSQPKAPGQNGEKGDIWLWQAWEIMGQTRVKADLVVLSACLTGLGQEVRGEGIIGLTRAFQYAGAKSVIVSLWSVSDASTAALMSEFYRELRRGEVKDVALQKAMVAVRGNPKWAHPYYWSAFILSGDWE